MAHPPLHLLPQKIMVFILAFTSISIILVSGSTSLALFGRSSPYLQLHIKTDTVYTCAYKYKTWFVSGGHNRWVMDNTNAYSWDTYFEKMAITGPLYQRRNGMMGQCVFSGHRDDIMRGDYLTTLQTILCYVANYNGSRQASYQSVPDINNAAAKQLWADAIEKTPSPRRTIFMQTRFCIQISTAILSISYEYIGLEVPDGAKIWQFKR